MPSLLAITPELAPLAERLSVELERVAARIREQLLSDLPVVQRLTVHVERYHGKMIRPTMAILCALAAREGAETGRPGHGGGEGRGGADGGANGGVSEQVITAAAVCEMIHLATLVHDDVLDEADTRRKAPTVNRLRGNEMAVILGDYLFSAAYHLCSQLGSQSAALLVARCGMTLCAGELLQLHHRENLSLDEATYYTIVEKKTASLIATACRLGALQGDPASGGGGGVGAVGGGGGAGRGVGWDAAGALEAYGLALGVAFQIQDDLLDLTGDQSVVGKSLGKDLEKGKLTLPVIHHLAAAGPEVRGRTLSLLENASSDGTAAHALGGELLAQLEQTGSVAHARLTAERFVGDARRSIEPLADSPAKRMLLMLADAVVSRAF